MEVEAVLGRRSELGARVFRWAMRRIYSRALGLVTSNAPAAIGAEFDRWLQPGSIVAPAAAVHLPR